MSAPSPTKRLVVIGGGMAGHAIAHAMQGLMAVTLIDPKTYVEVPMALPRLLVEPSGLRARISYAEFLPQVTLVQGRVMAMTDNSVGVETTSDATIAVPFDHAVIASGSRYTDPLIKATAATEPERQAEVEAAHARLRSARRVVIVGGGAVGVEVAAEMLESLPSVRVVLVHGGARLLENAPSKLGGWAESYLTERGVELVLNDRVTSPSLGEQPGGGGVSTKAGRTIKADAVVWATGVKVSSEFVARSWPEAVEPDGRLKVDAFLRVAGHPSVFVAGDAVGLPERRMAVIAGLHTASVIKNLKALAQTDRPDDLRLKAYKPSPPTSMMGRLMAVSLGRHHGLSSLPFGQFQAPFFARMKNQDMMVSRVRKGVGLKAP